MLDEALDLVAMEPLAWSTAAVAPSLPLLVALLLWLYAHRVAWLDEPWGPALTFGSAALSGAIVVGLALRSWGHGRLAVAVVGAVYPSALEPGARSGPWQPVAGLGVAGAVCLAAGLGVAPGFVVGAWLATLGAVMAVEGVDPGQAVRRLSSMPGGTGTRAFAVLLLLAFAWLVTWVNLLLLGPGLAQLARSLTGVEVGALLRVLAPDNEVWMLGSAAAAAALIDGVWALVKPLLYLEARLGRQGSDLQDRWNEVQQERLERAERPPHRRLWAAAPLLLAALCWLAAPAATAWAQEPAEVPPGVSAGAIEAAAYAERLRGLALALEGRVEAYDTSGFESLGQEHSQVQDLHAATIALPGGRALRIDSSVLVAELPEWVHTPETAEETARIAERLRDAADSVTAPASVASGDPNDLLAQELASRTYRLGGDRTDADAWREGRRSRLRELWQRFIEALQAAPPPDRQPATSGRFDPRWAALFASIVLALIIIALALGPGRRLFPSAPLGAGALDGRGGALPDARERSPLGWRAHADALAAERLYREAIRAQYLSVLARLDRTREIDYRRERTNGEHQRSFSGSAARRAMFADATRRFEEAWYGEVPLDEAAYGAMSLACDALVLQAPGQPLGALGVAHG